MSNWKEEMKKNISYGDLVTLSPLRVEDDEPIPVDNDQIEIKVTDLVNKTYTLKTFHNTVARMLRAAREYGFFIAKKTKRGIMFYPYKE